MVMTGKITYKPKPPLRRSCRIGHLHLMRQTRREDSKNTGQFHQDWGSGETCSQPERKTNMIKIRGMIGSWIEATQEKAATYVRFLLECYVYIDKAECMAYVQSRVRGISLEELLNDKS